MKFSERYEYVKASEVIIREKITPEIQNAICTCFDDLKEHLVSLSPIVNYYRQLEEYIWTYFLNRRKSDFLSDFNYSWELCISIINDPNVQWYEKLDLIEETITILRSNTPNFNLDVFFINLLNNEFKRLNFGYRIVNDEIASITDDKEIESIELAIESNKENVRFHLNNALKLYAQRPKADYSNSIKESITAVEALSREITGEKGLNFKKMEDKGLKIPNLIKQAFEKLYGYTNDSTTGIRHSLMDKTGEFLPNAEEALFMLITCSAFVNYLNSKMI